MKTELVKQVDAIRAGMKNEIGQHQFRDDKFFPEIDLSKRKYFTLHMSATENRTLESHGKNFHARDYGHDKKGNLTGRGWPGTAYGFGAGEKYGMVQAWPVTTVTYHAGFHPNRSSIGGVIEGNFEKRAPTEYELLLGLAMKIEADEQCGKRLLIRYHDEWKEGWRCPGRYFPKSEFARLEAQYYIDINTVADEPEKEADTEPTPPPAPQDTEDPANYPEPEGVGADIPAGCLPSLFKSFF